MAKADDSTLDPDQLRAAEEAGRRALNRASGWGVFPTPVGDILEAANLKVAPASAFDGRRITAYLVGKAEQTASLLKSAISKVFGILDAGEGLIHIDPNVAKAKQTFLKLHEAGHHEFPTHRKMFRFFQDCEKTLAPEIADLFEREANNFARFVLFQGTSYRDMAAEHAFGIKTPIKLASTFGSSLYASCREYVRTHHRACAVYVLEPVSYCEITGARARVRRIEVSKAFAEQFGRPCETEITLDHSLGRVLPLGRKMTKPTIVSISDTNGQAHECLAEAFDTKFNVLILVCPVRALTRKTVTLPNFVVS